MHCSCNAYAPAKALLGEADKREMTARSTEFPVISSEGSEILQSITSSNALRSARINATSLPGAANLKK